MPLWAIRQNQFRLVDELWHKHNVVFVLRKSDTDISQYRQYHVAAIL